MQAFSLKKLRPSDSFLDGWVFPADEYALPQRHIHILVRPPPLVSVSQWFTFQTRNLCYLSSHPISFYLIGKRRAKDSDLDETNITKKEKLIGM
jgi:hypothetical protein